MAAALHPQPITVAVVGDIHEQWGQGDQDALLALGVDLVLFVGDFGNESLPVVRHIAALPLPKASVFGNHDAWFTASDWGRKKSPYDHRQEDRVRAQQELLGAMDVSYDRLDFDSFNLSVVGGRPFTWGGEQWKNEQFLRERFEIQNFDESQEKIIANGIASPHQTLIFLGHNGPTGLGDRPEDICGRDWAPLGGDFGDPDFAAAIATVRQRGKTIPLVTFGHMHHRLRHRQDRQRERVQVDDYGTVYLNAACVPRHHGDHQQQRHNFSLVTLQSGQVQQIELAWVLPSGEITHSENLFKRHVKMNA